MWKGDEDWVKKCMEYRIEGKIPVGRPRRISLESVEADMAECYEEEVQPYRKTDYKPIILYNRLFLIPYQVCLSFQVYVIQWIGYNTRFRMRDI